jgi:biopolymer transport protein ExbB/TolQ
MRSEKTQRTPYGSDSSATQAPAPYLWTKLDLEERLGFKGGKHTRVNNVLGVLLAILLTVLFFFVVGQFENTYYGDMFLKRGPTPYFIVFFSAWSCVILAFKWQKLHVQRKVLAASVLPDEEGFVISPATVDDVMKNIYQLADDPRNFLLFNRILVALANLKNLGRVTDVDEMLRSQAEHDEAAMETSYSLLRGFIWVIPVLGFVGTVLGLSDAIAAFGTVLAEGADTSRIAESLKGVTAGLATAFETTLEALVAAIFIQLTMTVLRKSEEEFLDSSREYCHRNIVNRLRMTPHERHGD